MCWSFYPSRHAWGGHSAYYGKQGKGGPVPPKGGAPGSAAAAYNVAYNTAHTNYAKSGAAPHAWPPPAKGASGAPAYGAYGAGYAGYHGGGYHGAYGVGGKDPYGGAGGGYYGTTSAAEQYHASASSVAGGKDYPSGKGKPGANPQTWGGGGKPAASLWGKNKGHFDQQHSTEYHQAYEYYAAKGRGKFGGKSSWDPAWGPPPSESWEAKGAKARAGAYADPRVQPSAARAATNGVWKENKGKGFQAAAATAASAKTQRKRLIAKGLTTRGGAAPSVPAPATAGMMAGSSTTATPDHLQQHLHRADASFLPGVVPEDPTALLATSADTAPGVAPGTSSFSSDANPQHMGGVEGGPHAGDEVHEHVDFDYSRTLRLLGLGSPFSSRTRTVFRDENGDVVEVIRHSKTKNGSRIPPLQEECRQTEKMRDDERRPRREEHHPASRHTTSGGIFQHDPAHDVGTSRQMQWTFVSSPVSTIQGTSNSYISSSPPLLSSPGGTSPSQPKQELSPPNRSLTSNVQGGKMDPVELFVQPPLVRGLEKVRCRC